MGNCVQFFQADTSAVTRRHDSGKPLAAWIAEEVVDEGSWCRVDELHDLKLDVHFDRYPSDVFEQLDLLIRSYGDLSLLGFLLTCPSRADIEDHRGRLPEELAMLGRAAVAYLIIPDELHALRDAYAAARADDFAALPDGLRRADMNPQLKAYLGKVEFGDNSIALWLLQGEVGEVDVSSFPAERGEPPSVESQPTSARPARPWLHTVWIGDQDVDKAVGWIRQVVEPLRDKDLKTIPSSYKIDRVGKNRLWIRLTGDYKKTRTPAFEEFTLEIQKLAAASGVSSGVLIFNHATVRLALSDGKETRTLEGTPVSPGTEALEFLSQQAGTPLDDFDEYEQWTYRDVEFGAERESVAKHVFKQGGKWVDKPAAELKTKHHAVLVQTERSRASTERFAVLTIVGIFAVLMPAYFYYHTFAPPIERDWPTVIGIITAFWFLFSIKNWGGPYFSTPWKIRLAVFQGGQLGMLVTMAAYHWL